ncbi:MAG: triose-phosphate isomerase [Salibacteraceae bacterium]
MREKIVAGNWKMNKNRTEAKALVSELLKEFKHKPAPGVTVVVAPPMPFTGEVVDQTAGTSVQVGAQNCHQSESGAYTGEVAAEMLKSIGVQYVILGHSERRTYYGETDAFVAAKIDRALEHDLVPIYCCGELLEERKAGRHFEVIEAQLKAALYHLHPTEMAKVVIAYEPVWAIGTGETATPEQAQEVHAFIRQKIADQYGRELAEGCAILYGGSCKPSNAQSLFLQPDVDGGLIGGASLKAADFAAIAHSF